MSGSGKEGGDKVKESLKKLDAFQVQLCQHQFEFAKMFLLLGDLTNAKKSYDSYLECAAELGINPVNRTWEEFARSHTITKENVTAAHILKNMKEKKERKSRRNRRTRRTSRK